jgi:hypothetical protein
MVPVMAHESGLDGPRPRRRRPDQLGEALASWNSPGEGREALDAVRGTWPQAGASPEPAAEPRVPKSLIGKLIREFRLPPGEVGSRSLLGKIIREYRTASKPARNWIAGLISGVLAAVIGGLIVFYVTSH